MHLAGKFNKTKTAGKLNKKARRQIYDVCSLSPWLATAWRFGCCCLVDSVFHLQKCWGLMLLCQDVARFYKEQRRAESANKCAIMAVVRVNFLPRRIC